MKDLTEAVWRNEPNFLDGRCFDRMPVKCLDRRARKSPFLGFVGRQSLPAAESETAASILWFAAIQGIKRKQDLVDLAQCSCVAWLS